MRKMNRSATCVVGVIFYGSLKGGTMAVWLPFVLQQPKISRFGAKKAETKYRLFLFGPLHLSRSFMIIVVFQQADWLQLTASN